MSKTKLTPTEQKAKEAMEAKKKAAAKKAAEKNAGKGKKGGLLGRLAAAFASLEEFATAALADGTEIMYEGDLTAGTVVTITVDGNQVPLPEGTHELGGDMAGQTITVDATGAIVEVGEVSAEDVEDMDRAEMKKFIKDKNLDIKVTTKMSDEQVREAILEAMEAEEEEEEEEEDDDAENKADANAVAKAVTEGMKSVNKTIQKLAAENKKLRADLVKLSDQVAKGNGKNKFHRQGADNGAKSHTGKLA